MAPSKIGRFEIVAELGKHPLGMLYKANDPKRGHIALLGIESATLTATTRQQVQQLFSRARTATLLNSPNIASVYGGGEADGYVHLAMEFVDGVTLRTAMARDGKMATHELIDIARQLCNALDHAQSKGVVHQNLHPGNVKVEWDGAVKLMDMGLDIPGKHGSGDSAFQYAQRYAAPEQLRGEALSSRSNLYTLGAMLYELASGKKAISAEEDDKVREQVLEGNIPSARSVCPEIPKAISDAIAKAMAKAPSERFESASALLRELESFRPAKKEAAPVVVASEPAAPRAKAKAAYGGPDTSAIFKAMNENFRQVPGKPAGTAVAENAARASSFEQISATVERFVPTHKPVAPTPIAAPRAPEMANSVFAPVYEEKEAPAPVKETVYDGPVPGEVAEPAKEKVAKPSVSPIKVMKGSINILKAAALEKAKELEEAATKKPAPKPQAAPVPKPAPAPAVAMVKVPSKAKIVFPEVRKLVLVAAGMILAVGLLWGVSQFHSSAAESTPKPVVAALEPQPVAATPSVYVETAPAPSDDEAAAAVTDQPKRRATKKKVEVASAPAVTTGELMVTSNPEGAQIQIDGRGDAQWVTPHTINGLSVGEHTVTFSKPGFTTVIKTVDVTANQRPVVSVTMQQISAVLNITSEPAGATIILNGRDTGKVTPAQFSVSPGNHQVTMRKDGFFEYATSASAQGNQTVAVAGKLVQAGQTDRIQSVSKFGKMFGGGNKADMGKVKVKTNPKGAYIVINGKPAPEASPSEFFLNPGTYEIKMQMTGHPDITRTVQVEKGKRVELDEVFQPR